MPDHTKDRAIDALAQRQHGAFSQRQTVLKGFTRGERRSRLAAGRWSRLLGSNVFVLPSSPGTWLRQCMAATLSVQGSAIGGPAAPALHGFPGWPRAEIEVVTRQDGDHRSPFGKVGRSHTVQHLVVVQGIRVVSQADATVHIAPAYDVDGLGRLVDELMRRRKGFLDELHDVALAVADARLAGAALMREVLAERGPGSVPPESELNRVLQEFLLGLAPPGLEFEATPWWVEPGKQRVDALIRGWSMIIEADGRDYHTRCADFERDKERDAEAAAHGYLPLRFTWNHLVRHQSWCRTKLLAAAAHRAHLAGGVLLR